MSWEGESAVRFGGSRAIELTDHFWPGSCYRRGTKRKFISARFGKPRRDDALLTSAVGVSPSNLVCVVPRALLYHTSEGRMP